MERHDRSASAEHMAVVIGIFFSAGARRELSAAATAITLRMNREASEIDRRRRRHALGSCFHLSLPSLVPWLSALISCLMYALFCYPEQYPRTCLRTRPCSASYHPLLTASTTSAKIFLSFCFVLLPTALYAVFGIIVCRTGNAEMSRGSKGWRRAQGPKRKPTMGLQKENKFAIRDRRLNRGSQPWLAADRELNRAEEPSRLIKGI
ncbi:uncharacterized protein V1516DRAFT_677713 [Lipomyces oligophaga]|uniref:uncharacterized protein n=1 Tax=Lipomyces oligophaga TaxID=45792 RepID=UPI0034CF0169